MLTGALPSARSFDASEGSLLMQTAQRGLIAPQRSFDERDVALALESFGAQHQQQLILKSSSRDWAAQAGAQQPYAQVSIASLRRFQFRTTDACVCEEICRGLLLRAKEWRQCVSWVVGDDLTETSRVKSPRA